MAEEKIKNPAVKDRIERINNLLQLVKTEPTHNLTFIMGKFSLDTGLTEGKIREYLRILETQNKVKIDWLNGTVESVAAV